MKNPIKLIKNAWRAGMITLVVSTMVVGGLVLNIKASSASNPSFALVYVGNNANDSTDAWDNDVTLENGQRVALYSEIHNTVVGTTAQNVKIKATLPGNSGASTATVSADGVNSVSQSVNLHLPAGSQLRYIPGSTKMTWDKNGDGNFEFQDTVLADGIANSGLILGNQDGCNNYVIQITYKAEVVGAQASPSPTPSPTPSPRPTPSPTPTPTPTPVVSPSPTPTTGGNNNENNNSNSQSQSQTQENNQSVNVTVANSGTVAGASTIAKTPDTGVSVLGMASMFGAGPFGFALSRFGKGRRGVKKEESLSEIAMNLFKSRFNNQA